MSWLSLRDPFSRPLHFLGLELVVAVAFALTLRHALIQRKNGDRFALAASSASEHSPIDESFSIARRSCQSASPFFALRDISAPRRASVAKIAATAVSASSLSARCGSRSMASS